jgi:hypothetical protein
MISDSERMCFRRPAICRKVYYVYAIRTFVITIGTVIIRDDDLVEDLSVDYFWIPLDTRIFASGCEEYDRKD